MPRMSIVFFGKQRNSTSTSDTTHVGNKEKQLAIIKPCWSYSQTLWERKGSQEACLFVWFHYPIQFITLNRDIYQYQSVVGLFIYYGELYQSHLKRLVLVEHWCIWRNTINILLLFSGFFALINFPVRGSWGTPWSFLKVTCAFTLT